MEFGIRNDKITKALLRTTILKAVTEIKRDPKRSVRNLVDLGLNFAEGCNQREIFDITQQYLSNDDSAYFSLAENIVNTIEPDHIVAFGLNFGYNGCTSGARILREKQEELGCHIPFLLAFTVDDSEDSITADDIRSAVSQGMELGIYIYTVICSSDVYPELLSIAEEFGECAFIYFVNPRRLSREIISRTSEINNLVTSVRMEDGNSLCLETVTALREQGCPVTVHYEYSDDTLGDVLSDSVTERMTETGAIAGIYYPKHGTSPETAARVGEYRTETVRSQ
ncbi:hypothetical protein [Ruminococcus sp. YE78]|nr:hypothetical protein [Ruminococcus sp. YE78]SDA11814.1 hypothetical protein SAMN02910446_00480 [Ruminococcus sp. YE78]